VREALAARSDDDFVVAAPARRNRAPAQKGRAAKAAKPKLAMRALVFTWNHPVEIFISAGLASAAAAIVWNALALQTTRHPAPLFGSRMPPIQPTMPLPPSRPPEAAEGLSLTNLVPAAPVPSAPAAPALSAPAFAPPHTPVPVPRPTRDPVGEAPAQPARSGSPQVVTPSRPAPARDPIGDLIRFGEPAPIPPGYVGRPDPARTVNAGQRALARLNYLSSKPDGILGPETRQAIEQFERDRRLPVTGELGPRTARELSTASGIPID
jgi:hypothetical protein